MNTWLGPCGTAEGKCIVEAATSRPSPETLGAQQGAGTPALRGRGVWKRGFWCRLPVALMEKRSAVSCCTTTLPSTEPSKTLGAATGCADAGAAPPAKPRSPAGLGPGGLGPGGLEPGGLEPSPPRAALCPPAKLWSWCARAPSQRDGSAKMRCSETRAPSDSHTRPPSPTLSPRVSRPGAVRPWSGIPLGKEGSGPTSWCGGRNSQEANEIRGMCWGGIYDGTPL